MSLEDEITQAVTKVIKEENPDYSNEITRNTEYGPNGLNLDSLSTIEMAMEIKDKLEERYDTTKLDDDILAEHTMVGQTIDYLIANVEPLSQNT